MLGMVGIDVGIVACLTSYDHFTHLMGDFHGQFFERKEIRLSLDGFWCSVFLR